MICDRGGRGYFALISDGRIISRRDGFISRRDHAMKNLDQSRPDRLELVQVMQREFSQHVFAALSEPDEDLPPVGPAAVTPDEPSVRQPIDEFHRAVVLKLQTLCEHADDGSFAWRKSFQREQQLVLLGLEPGRPRSVLAEVEISTDLITKFRHRPVIRSAFGLIFDLFHRGTIQSLCDLNSLKNARLSRDLARNYRPRGEALKNIQPSCSRADFPARSP